MPQPRTFRPLCRGDYRVTPFKVYKHFNVNYAEIASGSNQNGFYVNQGIWNKEHVPVQELRDRLDATSSMNYSYKHLAQNEGQSWAFEYDSRSDKAYRIGQTILPSFQALTWRSLNHRYYKRPYDPALTFEHANENKTEKRLNISCSVFTLPYFDVGERIKPGSLVLTESVVHGGVTHEIDLHDDAFGNLRDNSILTGSFASSSKLIGYWGFNDQSIFTQFKTQPGYMPGGLIQWSDNNVHSIGFHPDEDPNRKTNSLVRKVKFVPGVRVKGGTTNINTYVTESTWNTGYAAAFNGNGFIATEFQPNDQSFQFGACDEFAISFWCRLPNSQSGVFGQDEDFKRGSDTFETVLISKRAPGKVMKQWNPPVHEGRHLKRGGFYTDYLDTGSLFSRYPFHIAVRGEYAAEELSQAAVGGLVFRRADGTNILEISSSIPITSSAAEPGWKHIVCQKSASVLQIYIDGKLNKEINDNAIDSHIKNNSPLFFGASATSGSTLARDMNNYGSPIIDITRAHAFEGLTGSLDEIRFFNDALNSESIMSLADNDMRTGSLYQTNVVGNVFYRNGQVVTSGLLPHHSRIGHEDLSTNSDRVNTRLEYRGTHTIYENEVLCRVPLDEFNVSINPTATYQPPQGTNKELCKDGRAKAGAGEFILPEFSASLKPYITSIGLYDDKMQMLAVGKLSQPIQKRDDIDMNFIVRWDY